SVERVPARVRLAVYHDNLLPLAPDHFLNGHEFDVQHFHHGPVLGPADQAVAGEARWLLKAGFDKVGQTHHAAEAVRVGLDVGDKGDCGGIRQACQESVGATGKG